MRTLVKTSRRQDPLALYITYVCVRSSVWVRRRCRQALVFSTARRTLTMSSLSLLDLPGDGVPAADIRLQNVARKLRAVMEQLDPSQVLTSWRLGYICRSSTRISLRLATRQSVSSTHGSTHSLTGKSRSARASSTI